MSNDMFEYASRTKIRFQSSRGNLTVEDLWDVPLRSRDDFNLNAVAKAANKAYTDATEENFVESGSGRTALQAKTEAALEIVKYVIDVKLDEERSAKRRAENKIEREKLLQILAEKQDGKLSELSEKELKKRIEALSA